jgi:signal transduction histidine kinase
MSELGCWRFCGDAPATARAESEQQIATLQFESLLTRISTRLAGASWHQVGAEVDLALSVLLDFYCLDQVSIFEVLDGSTEAYLRHVASRTDMPPAPDHFSYGEWFPWAFHTVVLEGNVLNCARAEELPCEASADRAAMRKLGLRSLLHIPLRVGGQVRFVFALGCNCRTPAWAERCTTRLKTLGEILAHAIFRAAARGALLVNGQDVQDILDIAHLGRWEWDIGADKLQLSDEAKHILGADVPVIQRLVELVEPADRSAFESALEHARAEPGVRSKVRYAIRTPAGETRTIQQWHEVMFPGERTARLVATVRDISSLIGTEHETTTLREHEWHSARVAQTTLLVASLAHELCQPLAAILNNAQAGLRFLGKGNLDREEMRDILTDIVASNRRANEVLGALRAMLRRQHTTRVTFSGADAVRDVLALVRSELMSEQIDIETTLESGCYISADKAQIEQVLLNLIMNSIDAMRGIRDGMRCLRLSLCATADQLIEVAVKDSGRGIPRDKRPKIFDAFWTTKQKGLGMGLPLCRAILESYGGRIWCEDNDAGGITFRFRLPMTEQQEQRSGKSAMAGSPRSNESNAPLAFHENADAGLTRAGRES